MNQNNGDDTGSLKIQNSWCNFFENVPKFKISTILENTNEFDYDNGNNYSKYDKIANIIKEKNCKIGQELVSIREALRRCSQLNETILCNQNLEPDLFPELVVSQTISEPQSPCCRCSCREVRIKNATGNCQKNNEDSEDLHEMARNLSTTLMELNSCKICKSFPEELKETVGTLKSLLDYVNEKTSCQKIYSNTKLSLSKTENAKFKLNVSQCSFSLDEETIFEDAHEDFSTNKKSTKRNALDFKKTPKKSSNSVKSCQCSFPINVGIQKDMEEQPTIETETQENLEPNNTKMNVYKQSPSRVSLSSSNVFDDKSKEVVQEFLLEALSVFDKLHHLDSLEEISAFSENEYGNQILNNLTKSELEFSSVSSISHLSSKISIQANPKNVNSEGIALQNNFEETNYDMETKGKKPANHGDFDCRRIKFERCENEITGKPVTIEDVRSELKFGIKKGEQLLKPKHKRKIKKRSITSQSLSILDVSPESADEIKSEPKINFALLCNQVKTFIDPKINKSKEKLDKIKDVHKKEQKSKTENEFKVKLKNEENAKTLHEAKIEKLEKIIKTESKLFQLKQDQLQEKEDELELKKRNNSNGDKIFKIVNLDPKNPSGLFQLLNNQEPKIGLPINTNIEDRCKKDEETIEKLDFYSTKGELFGTETHLDKKPKISNSLKEDVKNVKETSKLEKEKNRSKIASSSGTRNKSTTEDTKTVETDFRANVIETLNKTNKNVLNVLTKVNKNVKEALETANQNIKIVFDVALKQKRLKANLNKKNEEPKKIMPPKVKLKKVASTVAKKNLELENKECKVQSLAMIAKIQKYNTEEFYRLNKKQRRLILFNCLEIISDDDDDLEERHPEETKFLIGELKSPVEIKQKTNTKLNKQEKLKSTVRKNVEREINVPKGIQNFKQQSDITKVEVFNQSKSKLQPESVSKFHKSFPKRKYVPKTLKFGCLEENLSGKPLAETHNTSLDTLADVVSITQYEASIYLPDEESQDESKIKVSTQKQKKFKTKPESEPELFEFENLNFDAIFGNSKIHHSNCDCFDCLCKKYKKLNVAKFSNHSQTCCCLRCVEEILRIKNKTLDPKSRAYFEKQFKNCKHTVNKLKGEVKELGLASRVTIQNISKKSDIEQTFLAKSRSSIQLTLTGLKVALNCLQSKCCKNERVISHVLKNKQLKQNSNIFSNLLTELSQKTIPNRNIQDSINEVRQTSRSETNFKTNSKNYLKVFESSVKCTSGNVIKVASSEPTLGKMFDENHKHNSPQRGKPNHGFEIPDKFENHPNRECKKNFPNRIEDIQAAPKLMKRKNLLPKYNACWRPTSIKIKNCFACKKKNLIVKRFSKLNRSPKFKSKVSLESSKGKEELVADEKVSVQPKASEYSKITFDKQLDNILAELFQAIEEIQSIKHITEQKSVCSQSQNDLIPCLKEKNPIFTRNTAKQNDLQFGSVCTPKTTQKLDKGKVANRMQTFDKSLAKHPYAESILTLFNLCTNMKNEVKITLQQKKTLNSPKFNYKEQTRIPKLKKLCPNAIESNKLKNVILNTGDVPRNRDMSVF